jgi:hypothetical protein
VIQTLLEYYRLPEDVFGCISPSTDSSSGDVGFFQFGAKNVCYGRCQSGAAADVENAKLFDASRHVRRDGDEICLPFDFTELIENLRRERYRAEPTSGGNTSATNGTLRKFYYLFREWLPTSVRRGFQRAYFRNWKDLPFPAWPVDFTVDNLQSEFLRLLMEASGVKKAPFIWFWPQGAPNCLVLTHDVETSLGRDFSSQLMTLDDSYGFKASFQVIPEERYEVPDDYVRQIRSRGFEFNIHDLNHDGNLYRERAEFIRRIAKVNDYALKYGANGFRAGAMYRNQEWFDSFTFSYDMSVPNVAHLEPMRGGCCTTMPYFVGKILEIPLTATEDYSLFHILRDYSIDLWKQQMDLLSSRNGLMSFIIHPDYVIEQRARNVFERLLDYLQQRVARERIWAALPGDVDRWWRARSQMKLVPRGAGWEIVGPEKDRARLAYAVLDGDRLEFELAEPLLATVQ